MNIDELQAGRELDALIAKEVMGWVVNYDNTYVTEAGTMTEAWKVVPKFSTEIAAAWQVWGKLSRRDPTNKYHVAWRLTDAYPKHFPNCRFTISGVRDCEKKKVVCFASADAAPLAICRAALKAVME